MSHSIPLSPSAEPCSSLEQIVSTLNVTFQWPQTDYEETARLQCPCDAFPELTKDAFASRMCGAGGQWLEANVEACTFDKRDTFCKVYNAQDIQMCVYSESVTELSTFHIFHCKPSVFSTLKGGVDVLSTCVGVTSSLTAAEVALLTNAWAELLTPASVNDDMVRRLLQDYPYVTANNGTGFSGGYKLNWIFL